MKFNAAVLAGVGLIGGACLLATVPAGAATTTEGMPPATKPMPATSKPMPATTMVRPIRATGPEFPVLQLQEALNANGAGLRVDGVFGPKTDAALKAYQRDHNLTASGELDRPTRASLSLLG